MASENRGYSTVLVSRVLQGDPKSISVRLAKHCFEHNIPVATVAHKLSVSRASVYSWFKGDNQPRKSQHLAIEALIAEQSAA